MKGLKYRLNANYRRVRRVTLIAFRPCQKLSTHPILNAIVGKGAVPRWVWPPLLNHPGLKPYAMPDCSPSGRPMSCMHRLFLVLLAFSIANGNATADPYSQVNKRTPAEQESRIRCQTDIGQHLVSDETETRESFDILFHSSVAGLEFTTDDGAFVRPVEQDLPITVHGRANLTRGPPFFSL